jgi:hypothetical protein
VDYPDDGEEGNTNDKRSDNEYEVHNGVDLFFGKQVARTIAIADNHYPGFMDMPLNLLICTSSMEATDK